MAPSATRGWAACMSRARPAPSINTGSAMTRQVTDPGPNSPGSAAVSAIGRARFDDGISVRAALATSADPGMCIVKRSYGWSLVRRTVQLNPSTLVAARGVVRVVDYRVAGVGLELSV